MTTIDVKTWREVDALFAEKVIGVKYRRVDRICINGAWREGETWIYADEDPASPMCGSYAGMTPPRYSSSLDAAMEGAEKFAGWSVSKEYKKGGYTSLIWGSEPNLFIVRSDTPARGLVLACLKAVGVEVRFAEK